MSDKPTEKSRYVSKYAVDTYITAPQFLAEMMCERMAKKEKKVLPLYFWDFDPWKKTFVVQTVHANKLLKQYDIKTIIRALKSFKGKKIYSLGLHKVIAELCDLDMLSEEGILGEEDDMPAERIEVLRPLEQKSNMRSRL